MKTYPLLFLSFFLVTSCGSLQTKTKQLFSFWNREKKSPPKTQTYQVSLEQLHQSQVPSHLIERAPASINITPIQKTGTIIYTPLWIKIPLAECLEVVKNPHYANGACIKRR